MAIIKGLVEIILYVQDMEKQVGFYRDMLGLKLKEGQELNLWWMEFETGSCTLALHGGTSGKPGKDAPRLVFGVEDVEVARQELIKLGVPMGSVRKVESGGLVCEGLDPEDNIFSIEVYR